ncbi:MULTISPECIES: lasso RiPP family leader peptide-containing protein [Streptosporangium]|uniref:Lasso RiPP family leader peptide-containing protein n=1 Tax=Streptosporangium jomthongense TaxID=1193683 RepID=A0ABV8FAC6_9ACTN
MNEKTFVYEVPALVEVGDFSELTQLTNRGKWADSIWGYYFD